MGRRSHSRSLSIWTNGVHVARWTLPARGDMELQYDAGWVGADVGRPLSLSFNLQNQPLKGERVFNYFDNLLPDSDAIRRRVAQRFRASSTDPFDLLSAIGRAAWERCRSWARTRCRRMSGVSKACRCRKKRSNGI
ncbi:MULTISPECIES: HipA N-terminal domain-containing protein [unclassified Xanthomonas]|uniref:HipA N-terminal domain-containing protein n=1 Tax=Xanthomonas sp. LMG 8992 TaxID=1591157 RepID=UPI0018576D70|nr:HipA N-terminal domain-containing protein [Xanthomonas sp. LMG 8992]